MKVFDTDAVVGCLRGDRAAATALLEARSDAYVTSVTAAEVWEGAFLSNRSDEEMARVDAFLRRIRQVPLGPRAARAYGPLSSALRKAGKHPGMADALIAATVLSEEAVLVTRNKRHFASIPGLTVETW